MVDRVEQARSFDRAAEEYERTRPDYPDAVLDVLPLGPEATVVDVGAGTGKLTRVLARHYARVLAVEPLDRMRAILEQVVPAAESHAGLGGEAAAPGRVRRRRVRSTGVPLVRERRGGGGVRARARGPAVCSPSSGTRATTREPIRGPRRIARYLEELHAPSLAAVRAGPPFQELIARGPFGAVAESAFPHDHVLDRSGMLDNVRSMSWIASKPAAEQEVLIARLGELVPEGTYAIPNLANVMWAVRR